MTYSGLKSMIYAGLKCDDQRVKVATEWLSKHYSIESNPGLGNAGLFYYYHTFATALKASNVQVFQDSKGVDHNWREELVKHLGSIQNSNGSWQNENERWFENNTNLATAFALLALGHCR